MGAAGRGERGISGKNENWGNDMTALDARVSVGLYNHPKVKKLIRRVGFEGPWRLVGLWLYARQNKPDGVLADMTAEDIEIAVDWAGKPGELVAALLDVGFLDLDGAYSLHDWTEHQPWAAGTKERSRAATFKALKRHHGEQRALQMIEQMFPVDHASSMQPACSQHASGCANGANGNAELGFGTAPSPLPSPLPSPSAALSPADWIPAEVWQDFVDHRKSKRAKLTTKAVKLIVAKLDSYRRAGVSPKTVVEYAIEQGHTGLYYKPPNAPSAFAPAARAGSLNAEEID